MRTNLTVRDFSEVEKSWLAAALDSEGSIGLYISHGKYPSRWVTLQICNTDERFIARFKEIVGCGSSIMRTKETMSKQHWGNKPIYQFLIHGSERCKRVLEQIMPYLIIKREKAKAILDEIATKPFRLWTKERHQKYSQNLRMQWQNPIIRQRRLLGFEKAMQDRLTKN